MKTWIRTLAPALIIATLAAPAVAMNAADMARSACESPTGYPLIEDGISHAVLVWCGSAPEFETIAAPPLEPPPPEPVEFGVDCSEPLMVSLPDDVLTECE